jgi:hypothetical protein
MTLFLANNLLVFFSGQDFGIGPRWIKLHAFTCLAQCLLFLEGVLLHVLFQSKLYRCLGFRGSSSFRRSFGNLGHRRCTHRLFAWCGLGFSFFLWNSPVTLPETTLLWKWFPRHSIPALAITLSASPWRLRALLLCLLHRI